MKDTSKALRFLAQLSHLYEGRFLKPLWDKYPDRETDDWHAVIIFLEGYAFARRGAPNDFSHAGCDVIHQLRQSGVTVADPDTPNKAWTAFSTLLNNSDLNYANNPLCPKETQYVRQYKGTPRKARTSRLSVIEFLEKLTPSGSRANPITYAKQNLESDNLKPVHQSLSGTTGINGIGGKIASFFLRDVATFYCISPSKDRHLLQPVDVWIRNTTAQLMGVQTSDEEVAKWVVQESASSGVNAEAVNQGMWYFGSQVGGSGYRVSRALNDLIYAEALLHEHIGAIRSELLVWERMQSVLQ